MKKLPSFPRKTLVVLLAVALSGCAADRLHREGMSLIEDGKYDEGMAKLQEARQADPGNGAYKKDLLLQRDATTARLLRQADLEKELKRWENAVQLYNQVLALDRGNLVAKQSLYDIALERRQTSRVDDAALAYGKGDFDQANNLIGRVLLENPTHERAIALRGQILDATSTANSLNGVSLNFKGKKPVTLQFRDANLRMVMEAIAKTTGLNVILDKDVKADLKVTIFVRDTPVEEAIDLILMQTQTAKRVMGENSILIYPDTETKAREYAELKIRRFALTNADPKAVMTMVKTMSKTKDMFVDEKTNSLVVRDTPQIIRMIEKLIVAMDQPEPEVMLEVDVIEVSRERTLALGINLPTNFGVSIPDMTLEAFKKLTDSQATVSGMKVGITAQKTDADGNTLATPRIRVRNKEKAKFLVGDRLPVISSAATPSSAGGASVYNTTVQYVEVGIKIEAEPTIYADGEVAIKLTLEVSSASSPNADAAKSGTIAYSIGTRSLNTVLRLKDGQTEIIGGLIQDNDTSDATRVPGLGDIPILGRLFGVQTDVKKKKEVIMSITPRIVRNNRQVDSELLEMWSGTENNMRFGTRQVGNAKLQAPGDAAAAGGLVSMAPASGFAAPATTAAPAPALAAAPATSTAPAAAAPAATADAAAVPGAPRPLPRAMPPAAANPALNRALPATPPGAPGAAAAAVPAPRAATALAAVPAPRAASVAAPAALRPFTLSAPANAKVGDKIMVSLAFPPSVGSTQLEATLSYDSSRLKLLVVNEADAARNRGAALRFTGDGDSAGSVRVELVAGRGETLPASGGALAQVQFEVLAGTGTTPISVDSGTLVNDIGSTKLPATPSAEIDVK